jgi:hypothetical protein
MGQETVMINDLFSDYVKLGLAGRTARVSRRDCPAMTACLAMALAICGLAGTGMTAMAADQPAGSATGAPSSPDLVNSGAAAAEDVVAHESSVQGGDGEPTDAGRIEATRRRLSGGTFDQRQRAMWDLWRHRDASRDVVARAVGDSDPEVSSRAKWIIDRWRKGILPDTPTELARQLEASSHSDSLQLLLDRSMFTGALVAIDEAVRSGDRATLTRVAAILQRGFPFFVRSADAQDQLGELVELVDRVAITSPMLISRQQLMALIGPGVTGGADAGAEEKGAAVLSTPEALKRWLEGRPELSAEEREQMEIVTLATLGFLDQASERAGTATDPQWLRTCQFLRGDWAALGRTQRSLAVAHAPMTPESDRHWAYALVAAARAKDDALRAEAIAALSSRPTDSEPAAMDDPSVKLRWQVLAMHGEIDAAVGIVSPTRPLVAAELLAQAGRLEEAFDTVGLAIPEADAAVATLLEDARDSIANWQPSQRLDLPEPLDRLLAIARLLYQGGRRDLAFELYSGAATMPDGAENPNLQVGRAVVMHSLVRLNRLEWLAQIVAQDTELSSSGTARHFLSRALELQPETIDALMMGLSQIVPMRQSDRWTAVYRFLDGEVPAGFDRGTDYKRLFDLFTGQSSPVPATAGAAGGLGSDILPAIQLTLEMATIFELHGQFELAKQTHYRLAAGGDSEAVLAYAETELKEGRVESARELFEATWRRIDSNRQDPASLNRSEDDALLAMRAILGEAVAAARMGDVERSEELWRLIDLMMSTPSAKLRAAFGALLIDQGFDERAEAIYRVLFPWVAFGSDEGLELYSVSRDFNRSLGERHPTLAADVFDMGITAKFEATEFYPAGYVSLPAFVHRAKVLAAIDLRDEAAIRDHTEAVLRLSPADIDFGEKAIKKMREAGFDELADETVERIYQAGGKYMRRFPLDVVTANNLAWVLALSDHRLEDALALSWRAVYLSPDSTVYRDTLAEILFRLGRVNEATTVARACLIDEPAEWHVHEQIRRFEAAAND